ncbi:alkylated DNA repair protein AlkB [Artemisia annua]|uniref:Alkylated DNA repair protein AlkB n=1 Tax=Artemisia annua TaxID=35608 RepID=A0A2U1M7Z3_ARTAN|nr:alkylated DNA repair protein AlkB [Artemisia annua]
MCNQSSFPFIGSLGSSATFSFEVFHQYGKLPMENFHRKKSFNIIECKKKKPLSTILPTSPKPTTQKLGSGMLLWKNYISLSDQVEIVNICQEFGAGPLGFYKPSHRNGAKLRFRLMCFGREWDPVREYCQYGHTTTPLIPDYFCSLVKTSIQDSQVYLNSKHEIPMISPDVCIVKFYTKTGQRAFHQDRGEGNRSRGWPVVSISIGDSAQFIYGHTKNVHKADKVLLESGDVLIFGGMLRHIYHGVKRIIPNSAPLPLLEHTMLKRGRLNLSLTKF